MDEECAPDRKILCVLCRFYERYNFHFVWQCCFVFNVPVLVHFFDSSFETQRARCLPLALIERQHGALGTVTDTAGVGILWPTIVSQ